MADKAITELVAAEDITASDLFVLQQNDTAKKLPGQVLLNWLTKAADGHGGIQSYELLKTVGLVNTYRFTLADQTPIDIDVVDGRGVEDVQKIKTEGLVDTYQIIYNDGPPGMFTVKNGEKGNKGDNADIWIRYASQKPTAESHSFGEIPDAWIGLASGHLASAPTDWQAYAWYQWKGEKGDPGDPATLVSSEIRYQVGDSGIIIPSGSWSENIPPVTPGKYLWTRKVIQFNTGAPITSYSVSRFGIDGTGAVSTVSGVAPDENGNVPLDASSVNALSLSGGTMEGSINMNGQKLYGLNAPTADDEAATKGFVSSAIKKIDVSSQISGKVDKTKVVNNFTTTEEGFVADARTLKVLNESKLSMELLYENGNPTSSFSEGAIPLEIPVGVDAKSALFAIEVNNGSKIYFVRYGSGCYISDNFVFNEELYTTSRLVEIDTENGVLKARFYSGYLNKTVDNIRLIPVRIWLVKGVPTWNTH